MAERLEAPDIAVLEEKLRPFLSPQGVRDISYALLHGALPLGNPQALAVHLKKHRSRNTMVTGDVKITDVIAKQILLEIRQCLEGTFPEEIERRPVSPEELLPLREGMNDIATQLSRGMRTVTCRTLLDRAGQMTSGESKIRLEQIDGDAPLNMPALFDLETAINEAIFIPGGEIHFHDRIFTGEQPIPTMASIDWDSCSRYAKTPYGNIYTAGVTPLKGDSTLSGRQLGKWGFVNREQVKNTGRNQFATYRSGEVKNAFGKAIRAQCGKLTEDDFILTQLMSVECEEGEHAIDMAHKHPTKSMQTLAGTDQSTILLTPEKRNIFQNAFAEVFRLLVQLEPRIASNELFFRNIATGECWAELRCSVRAMERHLEGGQEHLATLTFLELASDATQEHKMLLLLKNVTRKHAASKEFAAHKTGLMQCCTHHVGSGLIAEELQRRYPEGMNAKSLDAWAPGAAAEQLRILTEIRDAICVPPEEWPRIQAAVERPQIQTEKVESAFFLIRWIQNLIAKFSNRT